MSKDLDALAAAPIDADDELALDRIAELYDTLDPVPDGLVERIRFGITLGALHAEIAELQRADGLVGVRSDGTEQARTVTFTSASLTMMVTIAPAGGEVVRIDGWIAPDGGGATVELRTADGTRTATADGDGRFVLADVPRGLAQFVVRAAGSGARSVVTPSIEL